MRSAGAPKGGNTCLNLEQFKGKLRKQIGGGKELGEFVRGVETTMNLPANARKSRGDPRPQCVVESLWGGEKGGSELPGSKKRRAALQENNSNKISGKGGGRSSGISYGEGTQKTSG